MKWFRVDSVGKEPLEIQANDEKDAIFQFNARYPDYQSDEALYVEEFLPPVKPIFIRVHLGFITVNLIPEIAEKLGYKEGNRFASEKAMFDAIGVQNIHVVEMWYKDQDKEMPTDFFEAAKFMVESTQSNN